MKDVKLEDKYGWYMRHRKTENENQKEKTVKEEKKNVKENNNINYEDIELDSLF